VAHGWIEDICNQPGCVKAVDAEMLAQADHPILEDDHMFSAFVSKGIVDDLTGYYNTQERKFYSIISLGREVCGFPRIVHGGLTAAIIDESFGGLLFALKKQKALPFWGPAYTVHLEVAYKSKIEAGRTILCTTEIESQEGRKLWMKATVSDGPQGTVYATARALFVAPRPQKALVDVGKYLLRRVMGDI
jgi:acyl-coenzyme A thioesterase PaaI-like protein